MSSQNIFLVSWELGIGFDLQQLFRMTLAVRSDKQYSLEGIDLSQESAIGDMSS